MIRKWWKSPRLIGNAAYMLLRSLRMSMRIQIHKHSGIDPNRAYIFAFWHGKQLLPSFILQRHHNTPMCAMVSPSRDGAMLTVYLEKCGFSVLRGSSRDNNIAALIKMKKRLQQGSSVGTGVDGPIGPMYVAKPGVVYLAQKCNVSIIPMGSAFNRSWTLAKAWDKFQIPKPFAKGQLVLGQPMVVTKDMDLAQANTELEKLLHQVEQQAQDLLT